MDRLWEPLEYFGEVLVFVGVIGEVLTERKLILKDHHERRDTVEGISSWVLIAGLAISLSALIGTNRYFNETVASLNLQAQQAGERAAQDERATAEERKEADSFQSQIAASTARTREAEAKVASAAAASKDAVAKVATADARIAEAQKGAASANEIAERERLARLQLEARLADRVITADQQQRITAAFASMRGQTVDVVIAGDSPEISRTTDAILGSLHSAGVLLNFFRPFGGGGAEGIWLGVRADAPAEDKQAGTQLVTILRETLDNGVDLVAPDDFDKMAVSGTGALGGDAGAAPLGKSPMRLQIAPK